jgi:hypothetical protein
MMKVSGADAAEGIDVLAKKRTIRGRMRLTYSFPASYFREKVHDFLKFSQPVGEYMRLYGP